MERVKSLNKAIDDTYEISGSDEIVAVNVTEEEFMEHFASFHCEWDNGTVIKMSPSHELHDMIIRYLLMLLETYLAFRPIGRLRQDPFVMRLPIVPTRREPDIQVILNTNPHQLKPTYMDGPADICIEIVSQDSINRDRVTKLHQYAKGGVPEYWILDPIAKENLFYRLNQDGVYILQQPDADGIYRTPALPDFELHVPTLLTQPLPNMLQIMEAVRAMLGEKE